MSWARPPQVSTNDSAARNDGLTAENDVLGARDGRPTGDFVPGVLCAPESAQVPDARAESHSPTVSIYSARV